jgi:hypothetical protein
MHYAIADFIVDIAQNSCEAGARRVEVSIDEDASSVKTVVCDDGVGMDEAGIARALDPFSTDGKKHPGRKVGLGLPFLRQAIDQNGGAFKLRSKKGVGTEVEFRFDKTQIDCPPLGDVPSTILALLCLPGAAEMRVARTRGARGEARGDTALSYEVARSEIVAALGDLSDAASLGLLKRFLASQEEN